MADVAGLSLEVELELEIGFAFGRAREFGLTTTRVGSPLGSLKRHSIGSWFARSGARSCACCCDCNGARPAVDGGCVGLSVGRDCAFGSSGGVGGIGARLQDDEVGERGRFGSALWQPSDGSPAP
jgi:hypothetical protein